MFVQALRLSSLALARASEGNNNEARRAMIAITPSGSMSVKAAKFFNSMIRVTIESPFPIVIRSPADNGTVRKPNKVG
jgi:hypothetical protein